MAATAYARPASVLAHLTVLGSPVIAIEADKTVS